MPETNRKKLVREFFGVEGIINKAKDVADIEIKVEQMAEEHSENLSIKNYITHQLGPFLVRNMATFSEKPTLRLTNDSKAWTNNNAESLNHVLKKETNWRPQKLDELVEILKKQVKNQYHNQKKAIVGMGDFRLAPEFRSHGISLQTWTSKSKNAQETHFKKFLSAFSDSGLIRSTDKESTECPPRGWGKKPHQIKRKIAAKTSTPSKKLKVK